MREESVWRLGKHLFFLLLVLVAASEAIRSHWLGVTRFHGFDSQLLLEAAEQMAATSVPRIGYWPNSSAGLDIVYWSHHLMAYVYAAAIHLFAVGRQGLEWVFFSELVLAVGVSFLVLRRALPRQTFWLAAALLLLEPGFHFIVVEKQYMRWPILLGLAAVLCLFALRTPRDERVARVLAAASGAFAVLSPLFFVSQGLPIALAIGVAFLLETWLASAPTAAKAARIAAFAGGAAVPLLAVGTYIFSQLDADQIGVLIRTAAGYGGEVAQGRSVGHKVLSLGFFFSTTFVSPYGLSLLPLGIGATVINLARRKELSADERFVVRLTTVCLASWLVLAVIIPTHFYAARMVWLMPLLILQAWYVVRDLGLLPGGGAPFVAMATGILMSQALYRAAFAGGQNPYLIGAAAAVGIGIGFVGAVAAVCMTWRRGEWSVGLTERRWHVAAVAALVLCLPTAFGYLRSGNERLLQLAVDTRADEVVAAARTLLAGQFSPGDWVVSNVPVRKLFPPDVQIQSVQTYRGLVNGAREEPGRRIVLIEQGAQSQALVSQTVHYRGYVYQLGPLQALPNRYWLRIGDPVAITPAKADIDLDTISADAVRHYLDARRASGLPNK